MATITVAAKIDGGVHPKYGEIVKDNKYTIAEEDFGAELFERPLPDWLSPHEQADKTRAEELGVTVGIFNPPESKESPVSQESLQSQPVEEVPHAY